MISLPLLTTSRVKAFRLCPRYHQLRYELGYRPVSKSGPLRFGSLFHAALEAYWKAQRDEALAVSLDALFNAAQLDECDQYDLYTAEILMRGYHIRWCDDGLVADRVEAPFDLALTNPQSGAASKTWRLAGKVDGIIQRNGSPWLMEHKTTSEDITPGSAYWQALRMDTQVSTYMRGADSLGFDVAGCLYDVIKKPTIKPYKATPEEKRKYVKATGELYANMHAEDETPEDWGQRLGEHIAENPERYYARGEVHRIGDEEEEAAFELWQFGKAIREAQLAKRWPRNPDACFRWHRPCEFFGPCTGTGSLESDEFVRLDDVHPELSESEEAA